MAALTGSEIRYARRKVGSLPVDADLQTLYDAYLAESVEHPLEWVILEVLETRLADLIRNPATFSVSGEYSQSTGENIKAMHKQVKDQRDWMTGLGIVLDVSSGIGFGIRHAEDPSLHR